MYISQIRNNQYAVACLFLLRWRRMHAASRATGYTDQAAPSPCFVTLNLSHLGFTAARHAFTLDYTPLDNSRDVPNTVVLRSIRYPRWNVKDGPSSF